MNADCLYFLEVKHKAVQDLLEIVAFTMGISFASKVAMAFCFTDNNEG